MVDQASRLDNWLVRLKNLCDMGDGEALNFYLQRTKRKFPEWKQMYAPEFEALEQAAARLEEFDEQHGRGASLNLDHRTVIQALSVEGHRYRLGMAENARQFREPQPV
ncbi:hypothetical protein CO662_32895 [Rhizobium anhuiense]|uniref:Uncharacterized protein n=1 Tax=Rhizobium anhuiense TaxID=1184720 RepID=A0ABX4J131_9HYPH|nr:hypothetical protein [Rhizobium anhuiense]PDS40866.1 hypothetical protein CO668_32060 [Rhizobium anhuiense]PDS47838.1 hypothetical protein CO662_32895 [Rhizobium anhuiense]